MPATLCFGDFTILVYEGYNQILDKLMYYNMIRAELRTGFDLAEFIDNIKRM